MKALVLLAFALETAIGASAQAPLAPSPAPAAIVPDTAQPASAQPTDPRIHIVPYRENGIVELKAALGYQLMIEFGPDERIENVAIGDSLGWQITPNRKANLLFVKPMDKVPDTNMTVVTNARTYLFEMVAESPPANRSPKSVTYVVEFAYPPEKSATAAPEVAPPPPPQVVNSAYSYTGSVKTLPARIFDDGHSTYFQFRDGEDYPAIFSADGDKSEAVVNSAMRSGYVVVDEVVRGFTLRRGDEVTHIYNDGFKDPEPGPLSPSPRKESCGNCFISCRFCL